MKELHQLWEQKIQKEFSNIDFSESSDYLCLIHYIDTAPQKFYSKKAFDLFLTFLDKMKVENKKLLAEILNNSESMLSIANKILNDINLKPIHDIYIPTENNDLINFIDKEIHYNLLKVYETPLYQFGYLIAKWLLRLRLACLELTRSSIFRRYRPLVEVPALIALVNLAQWFREKVSD